MHMANVLMWPQRISTLSDFYRKTIIASQALYGKVDPVNSKLDFLGGEGRGDPLNPWQSLAGSQSFHS